jgi:hypothetical protein
LAHPAFGRHYGRSPDLPVMIRDDVADTRVRMQARQRMHIRQSMYDRQARVIGGFYE